MLSVEKVDIFGLSQHFVEKVIGKCYKRLGRLMHNNNNTKGRRETGESSRHIYKRTESASANGIYTACRWAPVAETCQYRLIKTPLSTLTTAPSGSAVCPRGYVLLPLLPAPLLRLGRRHSWQSALASLGRAAEQRRRAQAAGCAQGRTSPGAKTVARVRMCEHSGKNRRAQGTSRTDGAAARGADARHTARSDSTVRASGRERKHGVPRSSGAGWRPVGGGDATVTCVCALWQERMAGITCSR